MKLLIEEVEGEKETNVKKWIDGEEKVRANEVDQRRETRDEGTHPS